MKQILIGNGTANYGASQLSATANTATSPNDLAVGALGIFDKNFALISSASTKTISDTDIIYIAMGNSVGLNPRVSMPITGMNVGTFKGISYTAPVAQVYISGYQGSGTSSINFIDGGLYTYKLQNLTPAAPPFPIYTSSIQFTANQTPYTICDAIAKDQNSSTLLANVQERSFAWLEVLINSTTTAITVGSGSIVATHGSPVVAATGHNVLAGDTVRFGAANSNTNPAYTVLSVTTNTFTLTRPYVNILGSGNYTFAGTTGAGRTATAPTITGLAGIRATVYGQQTFNLGPAIPNKMIHVALADDFVGTPNAVTTNYNSGSGTYNQVNKIELDNLGYLDHTNNIWIPYPTELFAVATATYDVYTIQFNNPTFDFTGQGWSRTEPLLLYIAIPDAATGQANFETTINAWMNSLPNTFPAVNI